MAISALNSLCLTDPHDLQGIKPRGAASIRTEEVVYNYHGFRKRSKQRGVPLDLIESAFLLGSLRRLLRPPDAPPLPPVRSLAYFHPVIEELLHTPISASYLDYLRYEMQPFAEKKITSRGPLTTSVQKTTDSDDR